MKIITHRESVDLLRGGENDRSRGGGFISKRIFYLVKLNKLLHPEWTLTFPPVFVRKTDIIVDGDNDTVLEKIGINGKIVYTPGHTVGSISVLLNNDILFCGDAAMSWPLWAGIRYCTIFVTDFDEFYNTWKKILQTGRSTHPTESLFPSPSWRKTWDFIVAGALGCNTCVKNKAPGLPSPGRPD